MLSKAKSAFGGKKLKIAIFDLTDCEGCELEFLNLREKLLDLLNRVEILNWRLIVDEEKWKDIDYAFVEGTPIKPDEIKLLKKIRENAKYVVALGTCACTGGIPALIDPAKREKVFKQIYPGRDPKNSQPAKPIAHYIKIDFAIGGCPVNSADIERFLASVLAGKMPVQKTYPVCLACKARQNKCLLLEGKPCMGPVTAAGCNAICPTFGFPCFGCLGPIEGANVKALYHRFKDIGMNEKEILDWASIAWHNLKEYRELEKIIEEKK